jgi:uncharacterized protein HemX
VVSAGYSPPEQYWGNADPRSDVYALGATMYFLLTGEEPLALQVSMPRKINSAVSETTDMIVQRATAQDAMYRYQSAVDMKEDLLQSLHSRKQKSAATRTALLGVSAIAAVIVLGLGASFFGSLIQQKQQTEAQEEQTEKQLKMTKKQLADEQARMARIQQAKLTDDISQHAPVAAPSAKARRATVAFREVDEAQLTDPDDALPSPSEAAVKEPSVAPPALKPGSLLVPKSSGANPSNSDEFATEGTQ